MQKINIEDFVGFVPAGGKRLACVAGEGDFGKKVDNEMALTISSQTRMFPFSRFEYGNGNPKLVADDHHRLALVPTVLRGHEMVQNSN